MIMAGFLLFTLLLTLAILMSGDAMHTLVKRPNYWQLRKQLLIDEQRRSLGGDMELRPVEVEANRVLMAAKNREIYNGAIFYFSFDRSSTLTIT